MTGVQDRERRARTIVIESAIRSRRSVRGLEGPPLEPAEVESLVALALTAPAPHHTQPWRFAEVSPARRSVFATAMGEAWRADLEADGVPKAQQDRALGMTGELVLHPSNVAILNQIYCPSAEEVAYYEGMIVAHEQAQAEGRAATIYDGEHIDIAHVQTAREIIALARSYRS